MKYSALENYIGGSSSPAENAIEVISPVNGEQLSTVPVSGKADLDAAVAAAATAFPAWSQLTIRERCDVFYRYRNQLQDNMDELARICHEENGKTIAESKAEVLKAIELTELACSLPNLLAGKVLEVSKGFDCSIQQEPLGVVSCITPFNFPIMVPHWTIPMALALGNTMVFKPSEQVPLSGNKTAELLSQAGLPAGVFNVIHGDKSVVEGICDHPDIKAVTFVGSTPVAKIVYARATGSYKRALAMGGAKNHLVVMPDADVAHTASNVAASACGCAGQRCMAAATLVAVGQVNHIIDEVVEASRQIVPGDNLGAVISQSAKQRIEGYITEAIEQGATALLDGRDTVVEGCEEGSYVGPTVLDNVTSDMRIANEEVFGPVLSIMRTDDLQGAIEIEQTSPFGNAAVVYTQDGQVAQAFADAASAGMIGVNVGVPVPREPFGFGGWNESRFGVGDITGQGSIQFWTQSKKITSHWVSE
ncbi:MAG TPA: methylmalonate-semialdehyde dehydrogenase (CoA acylating) [Planctomycetaceae bacterium]|nr:CoA-acylating methylmalonate-semialdehyde dehydrogenase [Pirellulales bacterium]HCK70063.1 methylmalonate-semialdehyde dehydrogenase (CoA acylating) [Planctomycetaceae bacterium]HCP85083.1 methylmalonate-semialdehyde dehydrogenase (CoA acylating) [Planctomycetaceae bacterium]|tara:strand:- start:2980 stop:4410 length:1431 start_codon:yes stop_codon:yes gene_type:complete